MNRNVPPTITSSVFEVSWPNASSFSSLVRICGTGSCSYLMASSAGGSAPV